MADITIRRRAAAWSAQRELRGFLKDTTQVTWRPEGVFRTENLAERHVGIRRSVRRTGAQRLESAVDYWSRGIVGGDDLLRQLRRHIADIGDGTPPSMLSEARSHAQQGLDMLAPLQRRISPWPSVALLAAAGVGLVAAYQLIDD